MKLNFETTSMKKRTLILIVLLICNINPIEGQICGTPQPESLSIYPQNQRNLRRSDLSSNICLNVLFHVVRNTNGTNAFNTPEIDEIVNFLNESFNSQNITINNIGVDFINNSDFVNIDNSTEARTLGQVNNHNDAINYYIVETLWNIRDNFVIGTSNSIPSNNLIIRSDRVLTSTSPHELGHCLNLLHTHQTSIEAENIDGSNCSSAGDLVCDTPADPRLGANNVNRNCDYIGGNGYNPLTNNIMSYSRGQCRDEFTNGQGQRMRNAISNEPVLKEIEDRYIYDKLSIITTGNGVYVFSKTWQELFAFGSDNIEWCFNNSVMTRNRDSNSIMIYPTSSSGNIRVGIRAKNNCGEYSQWKYRDFNILKTARDGGIEVMH